MKSYRRNADKDKAFYGIFKMMFKLMYAAKTPRRTPLLLLDM
jgi:hypothetical protein